MDCTLKLIFVVIAGFISGLLLGVLFRFSEAERTQAFGFGYHNKFLRMLHAPIWRWPSPLLLVGAIAMLFFVLWAPGALFNIFPLCGENYYFHKIALIVGVFLGAVIRWWLWKRYLQYL